eukprot:1161393-Pelagomonas_calceolata.AAC.6
MKRNMSNYRAAYSVPSAESQTVPYKFFQGVSIPSCQVWKPSATILLAKSFFKVSAQVLLEQTLPPWT